MRFALGLVLGTILSAVVLYLDSPTPVPPSSPPPTVETVCPGRVPVVAGSLCDWRDTSLLVDLWDRGRP